MPAIVPRSSAHSRTVFVTMPIWSSPDAKATRPQRLTRPYVGFSPTTPQNAAGWRTEPPVSEPSAAGTMRAATAAAEPPEEPPATREGSHGLRVGPNAECSVDEPMANSSRFVLPTIDAPPARRRATAVASNGETKFVRMRDAHVVGMSVVTMLSLIAMGWPSGARSLICRKALRRSLRMAVSDASTSSRGDACLRASGQGRSKALFIANFRRRGRRHYVRHDEVAVAPLRGVARDEAGVGRRPRRVVAQRRRPLAVLLEAAHVDLAQLVDVAQDLRQLLGHAIEPGIVEGEVRQVGDAAHFVAGDSHACIISAKRRASSSSNCEPAPRAMFVIADSCGCGG